MAINMWELQSNLSWKDAASSTKGTPQSSVNYLCHLMTWIRFVKKSRRKSEHFHDLLHISINENTFRDNFFFQFGISLSHCFSLLSAFLSSKPFQNNKMICEIIDRYFNVFVFEIQPKTQNLKSVNLGAQTYILVSWMTWIHAWFYHDGCIVNILKTKHSCLTFYLFLCCYL